MTDNGFDYTPDSDGVVVCDIDDPDDARLDNFRDLNSIDRRPDLPSGKGLVIAEGVLVVQRMLASRFTVRAFLGTERRLGELTADLHRTDAPFYVATPEVMADVIGFHTQYHCNNFLETCNRYLEARIDYEHFTVTMENRVTEIRAFPIGSKKSSSFGTGKLWP